MNTVGEAQKSAITVQLFILSCDRPNYCREAIVSALGQTYLDCEVIVSDNSAGSEVSDMLSREFPSVMVRRRNPPLKALDHFNQLIDEARAPLMVLFHDDDVLEPNYVAQMVSLFDFHPEVVAIGCNARIIRGAKITSAVFMGNFKGAHIFQNPCELLEPYLSLSLISPAPFPGYMYRTEVIQGLKLDYKHGGKHADVSFLCEILKRGPMLWTDKCLFRYRFHDSNDSSQESIANRLSWLRYIYSTSGIHPKSKSVIDYKFIYWLYWYKEKFLDKKKSNKNSLATIRRLSIIRRFLILQCARMALTRLIFWKRALRALNRG